MIQHKDKDSNGTPVWCNCKDCENRRNINVEFHTMTFDKNIDKETKELIGILNRSYVEIKYCRDLAERIIESGFRKSY